MPISSRLRPFSLSLSLSLSHSLICSLHIHSLKTAYIRSFLGFSCKKGENACALVLFTEMSAVFSQEKGHSHCVRIYGSFFPLRSVYAKCTCTFIFASLPLKFKCPREKGRKNQNVRDMKRGWETERRR